jgi:hypothetical protein
LGNFYSTIFKSFSAIIVNLFNLKLHDGFHKEKLFLQFKSHVQDDLPDLGADNTTLEELSQVPTTQDFHTIHSQVDQIDPILPEETKEIERNEEFIPDGLISGTLEDSEEENLINEQDLVEEVNEEQPMAENITKLSDQISLLRSMLSIAENDEEENEEEEENQSNSIADEQKKKLTIKSSYLEWIPSSSSEQDMSIQAMNNFLHEKGRHHTVAFGNSENYRTVNTATEKLNSLLEKLGGGNFSRFLRIQMRNKRFRKECIQIICPDMINTIQALQEELISANLMLEKIAKIRPFLKNHLHKIYKFGSISTTKIGQFLEMYKGLIA